ncbi:MAG: tetratricopeptide repeat protein [Pseudomonadota bacterium]
MKRTSIASFLLPLLLLAPPAVGWSGRAFGASSSCLCAEEKMSHPLQTALFEADRLVKEKSFKKALAGLTGYSREDPGEKHFMLPLHLGLIHYNLKNHQAAESFFLKATQACPCFGPAWVNLAAARQNRGNPGGAAEALEKGAEKIMDNDHLKLKAAILWNKANNPRHALKILTSPGKGNADPNWLTALAMTYKQLGESEKAAQALEQAAGLEGEIDGGIKLQAAILYLELGRYEKARRYFEEMTQKQSCGQDCLKGLIRCCIKEKRFNQADNAIKAFLKDNPDQADSWKLSAWVNAQKNEPAKAAAALEVAFRLEPPTKKEFEQLGYLYYQAGAPEKAAEAYAKSFSSPMSPENLDMLSGLYTEAHRIDAALNLALRATESVPTGSRWARVGSLYYRDGQYENSVEAYKKAALLDDARGEMSYRAGLAAMKIKRLESARDFFTNALDRAGADSSQKSKAARALEAVNKLMEQDGGS